MEIIEGDVAEAVRAARRRSPDQPLGYAAPSADQAIVAIEEGADEAVVLRRHSTKSINELVDRTLLRAGLRREREQNTISFAHAEKLMALGTLVAGVAHEVNNPLAALTLTTELLHSSISPLIRCAEEVHRLAELGRPASHHELESIVDIAKTGGPIHQQGEMVQEIIEAVGQMKSIVGDLRVFARTDEEEPLSLVSAEAMVEHAIRLVGREVEQYANLERDYEPDLPLLVLPRMRFTQVITNVLINASHAVRDVDRDVHRIRISTRADDEAVAISITDTGRGIPEEAIHRIFDPFFTTKRESLGTGLGLSISKSVLQSLGGDLIVESVYGDGAEFIMMLPVPTREERLEALANARRTPIVTAPKVDRLNVLVVDDDARMLRAYSRVIGRRHNIILASDGEEAMELLGSGSAADVVLSELSLPGVTGANLYEWLSEHQPNLAPRVLFISSAPSIEAHRSFLERVQSPLLTKPVERAALLAEIERVGRG